MAETSGKALPETIDGIIDLLSAEDYLAARPLATVLFLPGSRDLITWDATQGSNGFTYFFRLGASSTVCSSMLRSSRTLPGQL